MVNQKVSYVVPVGQAGDGFFGDLWNGVKSVGKFIGKNKVLSTVGSLIPIPAVQTAAKVAGAVGLGKGKKRKAAKGKRRAKKTHRQAGGSASSTVIRGVRSNATHLIKL